MCIERYIDRYRHSVYVSTMKTLLMHTNFSVENKVDVSPMELIKERPLLMGQVAACIKEVLPAKDIMDEMVGGAIAALRSSTARISKL